jgi:hypothetical protein
VAEPVAEPVTSQTLPTRAPPRGSAIVLWPGVLWPGVLRPGVLRPGGGLALSSVLALMLFGCPIYDDKCSSRNDCASGYQCDSQANRCILVGLPLPGCTSPAQCSAGETCTPDFECRPGSCDVHGCVAGYRCSQPDGVYTCTSTRDASADASDADAGDASDIDAATSSNPLDASLSDASLPGPGAPADSGANTSNASPDASGDASQ